MDPDHPDQLGPKVTSTRWLANLRTLQPRKVDIGRGASELSMWGQYLVYKATPTRYDEGDLYLYDVQTRNTTPITTKGTVWGIDYPTVGRSVIGWSELTGTGVGLYDLATHRLIHSTQDGGRAFTAGRILVYVESNNGRNGTAGYRLVVDRLR